MEDEDEEKPKMAYERANDRWEVAVTVSDKGFQHVSFVNSIATTKVSEHGGLKSGAWVAHQGDFHLQGGRHVDHVTDAVVAHLIEKIKTKMPKNSSVQLKPHQVKSHLWVFVNCLIENPTFDGQTKETMTLQAKSFGSKCELSEKFQAQALKCGVVDAVLSWVKYKQTELQDKKGGRKTNKLKVDPRRLEHGLASCIHPSLLPFRVSRSSMTRTRRVRRLPRTAR